MTQTEVRKRKRPLPLMGDDPIEGISSVDGLVPLTWIFQGDEYYEFKPK